MSCFPKDRPEFDLEIYDYLIEKGYPFVPLKREKRKGCYLFYPSDKDYIKISPYKRPFDDDNFDLNIYLSLSRDGCSIYLVQELSSEDNDRKCSNKIIDKILEKFLNEVFREKNGNLHLCNTAGSI